MKTLCLVALFALLSNALETEVESEAMTEIDSNDIPKDRCGLVVATNEDERLELFSLGHDNQIYHKYQVSADEWSQWASLGGVYIRGGPAVVRNVDGRLEMFARGMDKAIWHKSQIHPNGGTWTTWNCLGGKFSSSPVVAVNSEGYLHAFSKRD